MGCQSICVVVSSWFTMHSLMCCIGVHKAPFPSWFVSLGCVLNKQLLLEMISLPVSDFVNPMYLPHGMLPVKFHNDAGS